MSPRICLVTGAGSGIGAAIAEALAEAGDVVACTGRRLDRVQSVASQITARGGQAIAVALDVTDPGEADRVLAAVADRFRRLDVVVNNAGLFRKGKVVALSDAGWEDTLRTNLTGAFYCARAAARIMAAQDPVAGGRGHIVNINSGAGLRGYATGSAYSAAKFGLLGLSDTLRQELASDLIKVTDVVVATAVESELSNRTGVLRLPASDVGHLVRDAIRPSGRAVISRIDLEQLPG